MYKLDAKTNDSSDDMMIEFQEKWMKEGWELISGATKFLIVLALLITIFFIDSTNMYYYTLGVYGPMIFLLCVALDKTIETNKTIREYSFYFLLIIWGISVFHDSFQKPELKFNEQWLPYTIFSVSLWIFSFLNWRKVVMISYFTVISFIITMNIYCEEVPLEVYN